MAAQEQFLLQQAQRALAAKNFAPVIKAADQILRANPRSVTAMHFRAIALAESDKMKDAIRQFRKAIDLAPDEPAIRCDLAQFLDADARHDEAEQELTNAIAARPDFAPTHAILVEHLMLVGEYDRAEAALDTALERFPGDARLAVAFGQLAPRVDRAQEAADLLADVAIDADTPPTLRTPALFHLAELYDHLGEYDDAFATATAANDSVRFRTDPAAFSSEVDRMIDAWSPDAFRALPGSKQKSDLPVFIVGMPRSGTSLVEQILASHPLVHAGSELVEIPKIARAIRGPSKFQTPVVDSLDPLNAGVLDKHARQLLVALYALGPKARRVTDKLPTNFLHLGLIAKLVPNAAIIHCTRHPLDTCVSCYFKHFRTPWEWAYDLRALGGFYRDYQRVMRHWCDTLGIEVLEVEYEKLVGDQERESRRIVAHAGLDWDDACLRFYETRRVVGTLSNEQVRRPMYSTAVGRHRHYDRHLGPLRDALG